MNFKSSPYLHEQPT